MQCSAELNAECGTAKGTRARKRERAALSERERGELARLSRGQRVQRRLVDRAAIVLASASPALTRSKPCARMAAAVALPTA